MESRLKTPLAVVGMSCRFPAASSPEALWQLVLENRQAVTKLSASRLDAEPYRTRAGGDALARTVSTLAGIVDYPQFSKLDLGLEKHVVESSDRAHLMMCLVAHDAVEKLSSFPTANRGEVGVYVGHSRGSEMTVDEAFAATLPHLVEHLLNHPAAANLSASERESVRDEVTTAIRSRLPAQQTLDRIHTEPHLAAVLTAQSLGITGPAMVVNAACASSLQALWLAAAAIDRGDIRTAIVGGSNHLRTAALIRLSQAQALSSSPPQPFSADADGITIAEGYGAIVVKSLSQAKADGDPILGIIRSIGVASDGRGKSVWAPRLEGQRLAVERAYADQVDPATVQYVECHATSTAVGDATELRALAQVFGNRPRNMPLRLGSVKANLGHMLEAAGMAGIIKTVLALRHRQFPPQRPVETLNSVLTEHTELFRIDGEASPWPAFDEKTPRRAAVNAFGIGGLNVHVVLESADADSADVASPTAAQRKRLLPDAARTANTPPVICGWSTILPAKSSLADVQWLKPSLTAWNRLDHTMWPRAAGFAPYEFDWRRWRIPPKQVARANPLQLMVLDAAVAALEHAGFDLEQLPRERMGVVVGSMFASDFCQQVQVAMRWPEVEHALARAMVPRTPDSASAAALMSAYRERWLELFPVLEDETGSSDSSTLASRVTKTLDLMGGAMTIDAGDASAVAAISAAQDLIDYGDCDVVLCIAAHQMEGSNAWRQLSRWLPDRKKSDASLRPPLTGAAAIVLVNPKLATTLDVPTRGSLGRPQLRTGPARNTFAIESTPSSAHPSSRSYATNGHAHATVHVAPPISLPIAGHQTSAAATAVMDPFREYPHSADAPHGRGLQGMLAILDQLGTAQAGSDKEMSTKPVKTTIEGIDLAGGSWSVDCGNARTISPTASTGEPTAAPTGWQIVRASGEWHELQQFLTATASAEHPGTPGLESFAKQSGPWRIAIVAQSSDDLRHRAAYALQRWRAEPQPQTHHHMGVFLGRADTGKSTAFLFPGQASQYPHMLKGLVEAYPPAGEALADVDRTFAELGLPSFGELAWQDETALSGDVWRTQISLLAAATILHRSLLALGVVPDRISGHSFGEFPALVAAGAWSFEAAVHVTHARCVAIKMGRHIRGSLLASMAPVEVVEKLRTDFEGQIFISGYNSPDQIVCGGAKDALVEFSRRLELQGFASRIVDAPCPAHTPLMADVKEPMRAALAKVRLLPPTIPLLSSVTNRYVADPVDVKVALVDQLVEPVRYVDQIERLWTEGVRQFVEVGPSQVLTLLHRRILQGKEFLAIPTDYRQRDGMQQLLCVRAALEVVGALDATPERQARRRLITSVLEPLIAPGTGNDRNGSAAETTAAARQVSLSK
jgi:acyl transferase domain-containing protein